MIIIYIAIIIKLFLIYILILKKECECVVCFRRAVVAVIVAVDVTPQYIVFLASVLPPRRCLLTHFQLR